jgi:exosortase A-associated hydrolase 2
MTIASPPTSVSQPLFLEFNGRRLFALQIHPTGPCVGAMLFLPPFSEEMNRCRSHVVEQARGLAAKGLRCLLLDHHGTGESGGQSTEADWDHWLADAIAAAQWLQQDCGRPLGLWGLRTGALLAAEVAVSGQVPVSRLLLWQPVVDGKQFINQYLRLRIASQMVQGTDRETTAIIQQRLAAGEVIEVAGYPLTGRLADGIAARRLADFKNLGRARVDWLEVGTQADQALPPGSQRVVDALLAAGCNVQPATVAGPTFWQLAGTHTAPELQQATLRVMGEGW